MSVVTVEPAETPTTQLPTRAAATAAALDKLNGGQPAAAPAVAEPVTPPAAEPPKSQADMQAAIELERSKRELVTMRAEAQEATRTLAQERERAAARAKDPMAALRDAGHDVEDLVRQYVSGETPDRTQAAAPAGEGTPVERELRAQLASLTERFEALDGGIKRSGEAYTRGQRLDNIRGLTKDSEDYEGLAALDAHEQALADLEREEAASGSQFDEAATRQALAGFEKRTRDRVTQQLKALGNTKFAKQVMRELLEGAIDSAGAPTPTVTTVPVRDGIGNGAPVSRTGTQRLTGPALRQAAYEKALAAAERRKQGLS